MAFIEVASIQDIKPGHGKPINIKGITIALFNVSGKFYAIDNKCAHRGGPLGEGELEGNVVTCPLHGWQYDVTTGKNVMLPSNVKKFIVKPSGETVKLAFKPGYDFEFKRWHV